MGYGSMKARIPLHTQLIVALDLPSMQAARSAVSGLPSAVQWFKVGLELFCSAGPAAIDMLRAKQKNIFLDLKLHDIPNTVARAVRAAAAHNVSLLTVHALGGEAMLKAAVKAAREIGAAAPEIIAVTVLTSHAQDDLKAIGITRPLARQASALAALALRCGVDGLVASCSEAPILRKKFGQDFILVVPGIRPAGSESNDQKRTATPAAAVEAGADFIVVGRPIIDAKDPLSAASSILREMASAKENV